MPPKGKTPPPPPTYTPAQLASFRQKTQDWTNALADDDTGALDKKYTNEAIAKNTPTTMQDGTVLPCANKVKNFNCVPPTDTPGTFPADMGAAINKDSGTDVNWNKLSGFEGGEHTTGYVPWWPKLTRDKEGSLIPNTALAKNSKTGKDTLNPDGTDFMKGGNLSGVTIGTGVDLGQQDQAAFEKVLTAGKTPEEVKAMQPTLDKLKPYYGWKGAAACEKLRNTPLTVTPDEAKTIDDAVQRQHLQQTMSGYASATKGVKDATDFTDLTTEEQTTLLSREYQSGSVPRDLAKAIAGGNDDAAAKLLGKNREAAYLKGALGK